MSKVSTALSNYKVLQNTNLVTLPPLAILVGANGTGKSTLFEAFAFLRDCLVHNVRKALWDMGGFREVVSRGHENESIELWLKLPLTMEAGPVLRAITWKLSRRRVLLSAGNRLFVRSRMARHILPLSSPWVGATP